jgi:SAM-dependent methyltransferase
MIRIDRFSDGSDVDSHLWDQRWQQWDARAIEAAIVWEGMVPLMRRWFPAGGRLLEAGCGAGTYCIALRQHGYRMTGLDYSAAGLGVLQRIAPSIPAVLGSVLAMPFADGEFDGALALGVLGHFEDGPAGALAELARVVRPGGRLFVTVPHENWLWELWLRRRTAAPLPPPRHDEPLPVARAAAQGGAPRSRIFYQYLHRRHEMSAALSRAGFQPRSVHYIGKRLGLEEYLTGLSTIVDPVRRAAAPLSSPPGSLRRRLKRFFPGVTRAARAAERSLVERLLPGRVCAHTIGILAVRK